MPTKLRLEGLTELRTQLRNLPEDLAQEAGAIVTAHAEEARRRIQTAYPEGPTGNLKRGVTMERNTSKFTSSAIVRSRATHAHLYEFGTTKIRRTKKGASRGTMPKADPQHAMIPIVVRVRAQMVRALIGLVERAGFQVRA